MQVPKFKILVRCILFTYFENNIYTVFLNKPSTDSFKLLEDYVLENENFEDVLNRLLSGFTTKKIDFYKLVETSFSSKNSEIITVNFYMFSDEKYFDKINLKKVDQSLIDYISDKDYCVIETTLSQMRKDIFHEPILFHILPYVFTMPELQNVCEIITGKSMIRGNFYRKVISLGILEKIGIKKTGQAYKSPILYCFSKTYFDLVKEESFIF